MDQYRQLCRQIKRLPLDQKSLWRLSTIVKQEFQRPSPHKSSRRFANFSRSLDEILVDEKYDTVGQLLDRIYKRPQEIPQWLHVFNEINYYKLQEVWPQVHLIDHITDNRKVLKEYQQDMKSQQNHISLVEHFRIKSTRPPLQLIRKYGDQNLDLSTIMAQVTKRYNFIYSHQGPLSKKIHPLELVYTTNRFAKPLDPAKRDRMLREKISMVRHILNYYVPIGKNDLEHLYQVATNTSIGFNPYFYKYMTKKHLEEQQTLSNMVRKKLRQKQLVPNDNNIRKWYRQYATKQYYRDADGNYQMSWMQNFYE